jgi:hypothetical protein
MKLSESDKQLIIKKDKEGKTSRYIAKMLGIGKSTVGDFLRKETYMSWWSGHDGIMVDCRKGPITVHLPGAIREVEIEGTFHFNDLDNAEKVQSKRTRHDLVNFSVEDLLTNDKAFKEAFPNLQQYKEVFKIVTSDKVPEGCTHFVIPDTQVKPNVDLSYCDWVGEYMADKMPAVIIHIGDHADMESLSSYDMGTKKAEGKRIHEDFKVAIEGMRRLLRPIYDLQQKQLREDGKISYKPKMILTLGNHEERIMRHVNANPELAGFVSYDNLKYKEFGWEVIDYLVPYNIHGVNYVHYMANPMSGRPFGGQALNVLKQVGETFVQGHKQCLEVATRFLPASGRQQWAIIAGACYSHDEAYKGPQGNKHWRGVVMLHNVKDGNFNLMTTDLTYLEGRYGK